MRVISLIRTIGIITYLSLFLKQMNFDTNTFAFQICFEVKVEQIINTETGDTDALVTECECEWLSVSILVIVFLSV